MSGYPPGTPDALTQPTRTGMMHNLAAVPVFLGLPAAAFTCSWQSVRAGHRGFAPVLRCHRNDQAGNRGTGRRRLQSITRLVNLAGLFQRASIVTGFGWLTALSAQALTRASAVPARKPST